MSKTGEARFFQNVEGLAPYDFTLQTDGARTGVSAMLRVKNEAPKIRWCLASLLGLFDEIVVIDNGSEDETRELVRAFKQEHDRGDTIRTYDYPFIVARCGPEHAATPEYSVHNLAYYYNWSLSRCSQRYVCKWDADMVVRREERQSFSDMLQQLDHQEAHAMFLPGQTVYRDAAGRCFLSSGELLAERRLFPHGRDNYYAKGEHFERLRLAPAVPIHRYDGVVFYELKFVDEDEFSHWSTTKFPTARKQQEWDRIEQLRAGGDVDGRFVPLPANFLNDQCGGLIRDEAQ